MKKLLILFLLILRHTAFSYDNLNLEEYTRKLNKIDRIEKDLDILQKQFYRGSKNNKVTIEEPSINPNIEIRISDIEEQMRSLKGEIERIEYLVQVQENNFKKLSEDIEFRFKEEKEQNTKESAENFTDAPKNNLPENSLEVTLKDDQELTANNKEIPNSLGVVKTKDANQVKAEIEKKKDSGQLEFEEAFALLKANKFKEAEENFKKIIAQDKNEETTSRSLYWLGEIYIAKKNYEQAAINFLQSYKKSPKHTKAPESLVKLVGSLRQLKKNKEACAIISKAHKEFPNMSDKLDGKLQEESDKLSCE